MLPLRLHAQDKRCSNDTVLLTSVFSVDIFRAPPFDGLTV
jgi:hypothetical protein